MVFGFRSRLGLIGIDFLKVKRPRAPAKLKYAGAPSGRSPSRNCPLPARRGIIEGMEESGSPIATDFLTIGAHSTVVVVRRRGALFVAHWECSCGAHSAELLPGLLAPVVLDAGKRSYRAHCAKAHP
jgi:hypothetical protein